jgi:hypothetical protein
VAPVNDAFASPIVLAPGSQEFIGTVYGATKEVGEPDLWFYTFGSGSAWWTWTPTMSGFAALTLPENPPVTFGAPPELHVSRGNSLETFATFENRVAILNAGPGFYTGFPVTAGQTYRMAMLGDPATNISQRFALTVSATPIISQQPLNQSVKPGGAALFSVLAPGTEWNNVRWQFNGVDIVDGVGPTLGIYNANVTNVGAYRAVVTSGGISSTSLIAMLSLNDVERQPSIRLEHAAGTTNNFSVSVLGETNQFYLVQGSRDFVFWRLLGFSNPSDFQIENSKTGKLRVDLLEPHFMALRAVRRGDLRDACIVNLRRIDMAKEAWKVRYRKTEGVVSQDDEVNQFFASGLRPRCPANGEYTYHAVGTQPTCSIPNHSL